MAPILQDESDVIPISPAAAAALSDEEFLRHLVWADNADSQLAKAAREGEVATVVARLRKRNFGLGAKAVRKSVFKMRFDPAPAAWSTRIVSETESTRNLFEIWSGEALHSGKKKQREGALRRLAEWTDQRDQTVPLTTGELLILCELLRWEHASLSDDLLWTMWRLALTATLSRPLDEADPLAALVRTGELAWTTGLLFADVFGLEALRERGRVALWDRLEESTDGDGTPRAELLDHLADWLAIWTRATEWGHAAKVPLWADEEQAERFAGLVEACVTLLGPHGELSRRKPATNAVPLLATAAKLAGWKKKHPAFRLLLSHSPKLPIELPTASPKADSEDDPNPAFQADFASLVCLRSDWTRTAGRIVVMHHETVPQLALSSQEVEWLSGLWHLELDGVTNTDQPTGDWTCSCWFTDDEVSFVELQWKVSREIHIERQILLARDEQFAVFADCVRGMDETPRTLRSCLPLGEGVQCKAEKNTRTWRLEANERTLRVFPLPLPDDFLIGTPGRLQGDEQTLTFETPVSGGAYLPMVLDWHPNRQNRRVDWRQLTVTEDGRRVGPDVAGGYRLRVGSYQLLLYRSLTEKRLRTVLGHHTGHETVIGRFDSEGDVQPLLLVE